MTIADLHKTNPYEGFPILEYREDVRGWNYDDSVFDQMIEETRPKLILEVGTWLGGSALRMADAVKRAGLDCRIVCVDTWLGALEMWTNQDDPERYGVLRHRNGYPDIYRQFLANVIHRGHDDIIIPFPQTSRIAAQWFRAKGIHFDLAYIDGSHDFGDVWSDLTDYSQLAGTLFGDDYHTWADVKRAVREFTSTMQSSRRNLQVTASGKWIIKKR